MLKELKAEQSTAMSKLTDSLKAATDKIAELATKVESADKSDAEKAEQVKIDEATKESKVKAEKAEAEVKRLKEELDKATKTDREAARALAITEAVKTDSVAEYGAFFRNRLEAVPKSEELTAEVVERCRVEGESIWVSIGKPEGVGRLPKDGDRENGNQNNKGGDGDEVLEGVNQFAVLSGVEE